MDRRNERFDPRSIAASAVAHLAVLLGVVLLPGSEPPAELPLLSVELIEESGAAGAAGRASGSAPEGGAGMRQASSAARLDSAPTRGRAEDMRPADAAVPPPSPRLKPAVPVRPPKPAQRPEPPPVEAREPVTQTAVAQPMPMTEHLNESELSAASDGSRPGEVASGGGGQGAEGKGAGMLGTDEGPGDEYMERLRRWVAKFKKFPPEARKLKQEGTVVVAFVLARDGVVLDAQIERSSGFPLIDEAALAMLCGASPVPPVPPSYPGDRLSIALPVRYSIGFFGRLF